MTRQFPARPVVGVGAVVLDGARVLLARRAHEPLQGQWSLPGGAVELGETLEQALVREVREETGLTIAVGPVVEIFERIQPANDGRIEFHYVIVDYLCQPTGSIELIPGSDADAVCWADAGDLGAYRLTEKATEVIGKALAMAWRAEGTEGAERTDSHGDTEERRKNRR